MEKEPNKVTMSIWVLLNIAHKHVNQAFEKGLKAQGLPPASWYDVLLSLELNPKGLRQNQLEKMSLFSQVNLSRNLKRMTEEGLVTHKPAEGDGRGKVLALTPDGLAKRKQMWEVYGGLMISEIESRVPADLAPSLVEGLKYLAPESDWDIETG